ncbi:MAG TPA: hypothetical protein VFI24_13205 [Pyrinomonadaceae bacterium]|nr:hypothetical protein [Pyrinomonadaceae bacterium]
MESQFRNDAIVCPEGLSSRSDFNRPTGTLKPGHGVALAHHGELLQGVFEGTDGRLKRVLVSIPCGIFKSEVRFVPDDSAVVEVEPHWKIKSSRAIALTLNSLGKHKLGGRVQIRSNIPVGWGLGSSTSDVTAAIRATANALNERITPHEIAALAVRAETACDSTMFGERMVLFAQREGIVVEDFRSSLPKLEVLGFNASPNGNGVDTIGFPPARYSWWEIEAFRPMVGLLRQAVSLRSPQLLGQVSSASATINQHYLPTPHFQNLKEICAEVGAVGLQVAHTGTIAGLLFDPHDPLKERRVEDAQTLLTTIGIKHMWVFQTSGNGLAHTKKAGNGNGNGN